MSENLRKLPLVAYVLAIILIAVVIADGKPPRSSLTPAPEQRLQHLSAVDVAISTSAPAISTSTASSAATITAANARQRDRIQQKIAILKVKAPSWIRDQGGNPHEVDSRMKEFTNLLSQGKLDDAEKKLDEITALVSKPPAVSLIDFGRRMGEKFGALLQAFVQIVTQGKSPRAFFALAAQLEERVRAGKYAEAEQLLSQATQNLQKIALGHGVTAGQMVFMYSSTGDMVVAPGSPFEVAVMNLDGTGFKQLTNDGTQKFLPHFSPDGTKIVYTKFQVGGYGSPDAQTDVYSYDLASDKETRVTSGGTNGYGTWSPDGTRIAYLHNAALGGPMGSTTIMTIGVDGSNPQTVGVASGDQSDLLWADLAWSKQNWILFVVGQNQNGTFCKARIDKIRPDGSSRTKVSDGGPSCTPPGKEAIGDSDPGWSSDGRTIYSGRGVSISPTGAPSGSARKLYALSSDAWYSGKAEQDLSLPSEPNCIEGAPKGSPDGKRILLVRVCFDTGKPVGGIYVTDTTGSYRTLVTQGSGPDWNPVAK